MQIAAYQLKPVKLCTASIKCCRAATGKKESAAATATSFTAGAWLATACTVVSVKTSATSLINSILSAPSPTVVDIYRQKAEPTLGTRENCETLWLWKKWPNPYELFKLLPNDLDWMKLWTLLRGKVSSGEFCLWSWSWIM